MGRREYCLYIGRTLEPLSLKAPLLSSAFVLFSNACLISVFYISVQRSFASAHQLCAMAKLGSALSCCSYFQVFGASFSRSQSISLLASVLHRGSLTSSKDFSLWEPRVVEVGESCMTCPKFSRPSVFRLVFFLVFSCVS